MMLDKQALFSDKQAVTTGTQLSTNAYDLGVGANLPFYGTAALHDPGRGQPVEVLCQVDTTFTGGTSLQVNLVMSAASDLSGATVLMSSAVIAEASLVAGYRFRIGTILPPGVTLRYLGLQFVTVGTHTGGTITAGPVFNMEDNYAPL